MRLSPETLGVYHSPGGSGGGDSGLGQGGPATDRGIVRPEEVFRLSIEQRVNLGRRLAEVETQIRTGAQERVERILALIGVEPSPKLTSQVVRPYAPTAAIYVGATRETDEADRMFYVTIAKRRESSSGKTSARIKKRTFGLRKEEPTGTFWDKLTVSKRWRGDFANLTIEEGREIRNEKGEQVRGYHTRLRFENSRLTEATAILEIETGGCSRSSIQVRNEFSNGRYRRTRVSLEDTLEPDFGGDTIFSDSYHFGSRTLRQEYEILVLTAITNVDREAYRALGHRLRRQGMDLLGRIDPIHTIKMIAARKGFAIDTPLKIEAWLEEERQRLA